MAIFHKTLQHHEDTTEKRDISQEDIEFLKRLQLEMNTQDTTGTADPRFWVIKGSERVVDNENPDELVLQEERFCYNMSYFHIVQELFLFRTYHSGGTSTMAKCKQLGVDSSENVEFKFEEGEEGE